MDYWQNLRDIESAAANAFGNVTAIKIKRIPGHKFYHLDRAPKNAEMVKVKKSTTDDGSYIFSDPEKLYVALTPSTFLHCSHNTILFGFLKRVQVSDCM